MRPQMATATDYLDFPYAVCVCVTAITWCWPEQFVPLAIMLTTNETIGFSIIVFVFCI